MKSYFDKHDEGPGLCMTWGDVRGSEEAENTKASRSHHVLQTHRNFLFSLKLLSPPLYSAFSSHGTGATRGLVSRLNRPTRRQQALPKGRFEHGNGGLPVPPLAAAARGRREAQDVWIHATRYLGEYCSSDFTPNRQKERRNSFQIQGKGGRLGRQAGQ